MQWETRKRIKVVHKRTSATARILFAMTQPTHEAQYLYIDDPSMIVPAEKRYASESYWYHSLKMNIFKYVEVLSEVLTIDGNGILSAISIDPLPLAPTTTPGRGIFQNFNNGNENNYQQIQWEKTTKATRSKGEDYINLLQTHHSGKNHINYTGSTTERRTHEFQTSYSTR